MIGIDMVEVGRLERALERRPRLAERLFTEGELEYASSRRRPAMHLAARFAAKEAAVKALGAGGVAPAGDRGRGRRQVAPGLVLHGAAAEAATARGVVLEVSLTHTRGHAAAVVQARPAETRLSPGWGLRCARDGELARTRPRRRRDAGDRRLGDRGSRACPRWS